MYKIVPQESRYIPWNQEVRENELQIWQPNCLGPLFYACRWMKLGAVQARKSTVRCNETGSARNGVVPDGMQKWVNRPIS